MLAIVLLVGAGAAQTRPPSDQKDKQINVNWLYGAYIPKDVPIVPLGGKQRFHLYLRQTYLTPGIYVKTGFFALRDQAANSPPHWGDGIAGFGKRYASRQAQFIIQNSFQSIGNAAVGWEPRYDRCRCSGFWPRTRHATFRNFVTYGRDDKALRPQLMPYAAAFGGGAIAALWQPDNPRPLVRGYQGVIAQAGVGIATNMAGEFIPDILRVLRKKK
jgi:hypothetical protein